ncbi:MAG: SprT-like domain-containing protein [Bacteroidetes bacterium]|nr:SprT-like domain-containing protein [Bacteroidota bacterium]
MDPRLQQFHRNSEVLKKYIPEPAVPVVARWVVELDFKLKITKERQSKLGDYTPPHQGLNHTITINHNLNQYAFFITLVHEIAHLTTYNKYRNSVAPHGEQWKQEFKTLMQPFLDTAVFPVDVLYALRKYLQNPAAASCSDVTLLRTLKLYDDPDEHNSLVLLEHLPYKTHFLYNGSRIFEKGERLRKRFRCKELASGAIYLFSPMAEVELFEGKTA